jgi:hypothetical protein
LTIAKNDHHLLVVLYGLVQEFSILGVVLNKQFKMLELINRTSSAKRDTKSVYVTNLGMAIVVLFLKNNRTVVIIPLSTTKVPQLG